MKKISAFVLMVLIAALAVVAFGGWSGLPQVSAATTVGIDDTGGQQGVDWLKALSRSRWAELVFAVALLASAFCILFTKHRGYGIIAFVFLIFIGAYAGLVEALWTWVSGWNSGSSNPPTGT